MSDKDEIKELFQKELGNYQAKVNPNLWNGIQAGLGSAGAATGGATSLGLVGKIVIGVSIAAAVTVGTLLVVNNDEKETQKEQTITDLKSEDSISKSSEEQIKFEEETINSSTITDDVSKEIENKERKIELSSDENENIITTPKKVIEKEEINKNSTPFITLENPILSKNKIEKSSQKNTSELEVNEKIKSEALANNSEIETTKEEIIKAQLGDVSIQIREQKNQYVSFTAEGVPNNEYIVWDFGDGTIDGTLNPEHFYAETGIYDVSFTVKTAKEEITKNLQVEIKILGEIGDLPNVFTPNGDGNNDEFFVNCKNIKSFQLTIMDNQQNIIYTTNDVDFRWNGFDKSGQPAKEGTYFYIIVAQDESGNTINKYQQLRLQR